MNLRRVAWRVGAAVGAALLVGGLVSMLVPSLVAPLTIGAGVLPIFGLASALLALWVLRKAYASDNRQTAIPAVEGLLSTPPPGNDIDEIIYRLTRLREGTIEYRERIRKRVTETAIAVIMQREDCSRGVAVDHLESGSWTDDTAAASFFRHDSAGTGSPSLIGRVFKRFGDRETAYQRQLRATITAIESKSPFDISESASDDAEAVSADGFSLNAIVGWNEDSGERVSETTRYRSLLSTGHWTGITAFTLAALAGGIIASQPPLVVASAVGLGAAGYARLTSPPPLTQLDVTRMINETTPEPGEEVEITVTVENTGDSFLPDLRMIDRVPPTLRVVEGSVRLGAALQAGETTSFSYTIVAERGTHNWPLQAIGRDISGAIEREALIDADATINCVPELKTTAEMSVRPQTAVYAGSVATEVGGEGLEFFSIRDYQLGDPKRRIDWNTYARTGEFSTVDFREEHAARVVLLLDGRESAYVSPAPGERHAVNQSVDAALDVFASLYDQGHLVGVAAFNGIPLWLGPSTGRLHRKRVRDVFTEHPAISSLPPEATETELGQYVDPMTQVRRRLPQNTQIFLFSPLTDEYTYEVARRLDGSGHLVTVISPNPTADRTIGQRLARLERLVLIKRLRDHGIRVVDWSDDQPLGIELEYAKRRWSS